MEPLITRTISIPTNGIRLHAQTAGPDDGPLVILLHGFPEFWWGWHRQIGSLAQARCLVAAPDQRGYNLSDKPGAVSAYTIDALALDVLGILDHFGRRKAVIAGHDWGAAVAWYLGMYFPERVERLIIANVPHQAAMSRALQKPVWEQLRKSWYIFFFQIPRLPEWAMRFPRFAPLRRTFLQTSRPGTFSPQDIERYAEAWHRPGALTGGINWYRAMARLALRLGQAEYNRRFEVRVRVPTLILWGDQDAFIEPFLADWSMDWVDDGRLVHFPLATHWLLHEEAGPVSQHMLDFMKETG
jgi:pimeloyl-ACP methyl ester carboxylesterase